MGQKLQWELILRPHEIIQKGLGQNSGAIKKYYIGVPDNENTLVMPCLATELTDIESRLGPTGMDRNVYTFDMYLFFDKKKGIANAGGKTGERARASYEEMLDLLSGLDFTGNYAAYKPRSIMGILRSHIFLSGDTINTDSSEIAINSDIDVTIGPSDTERSFFEVKITIKVSQLILLTSRI